MAPNDFSADLLQAGTQRAPTRTIEWFDVPDSMPLEQRQVKFHEAAEPLTVESIGFVLLSVDEEKMAIARAGGDPMQLPYEQCLQSLRAWRAVGDQMDRTLSLADGSADALWHRLQPALRTLVVMAWGQIHTPPAKAIDDFLASRRTGPKKPAPAPAAG